MQSFQCARAAAALLVVYFHSVLQISHVGAGDVLATSVAPPLLGKSGVDIFFVLSGVLIWCSTRDGQTISSFYRKRLLRIAPLYWLLTLIVATAAILIPTALRSTQFEAAHVLASLVFLPWPNPASHGGLQDLMTPPIVPGWTLNFEIFFYAVFGLTLAVPRHLRLQAASSVFGVAIAIISILGPDSLIIRFYDPGLILEFIAGLCLGYVLESDVRIPVASAWLLLAAALDLLLLLDWNGCGLHRFYVSGLPASLLLFSLAMLETKGHWPKLPWLVAVGDATYSLYLTHIFVLAGLRVLLSKLGASLDTWAAQSGFLLAAMVFSVLVGVITYRVLELPLGHALRQAGMLRKQPTTGVALAVRGGKG